MIIGKKKWQIELIVIFCCCCSFLINVLQMFFLSIPTGEVCPRFTAQGSCMQNDLDSPISLRTRGNSYTTCFPCRLTPFFILRVALNWTCKSFWKSAFGCICPAYFWDPWHSTAGLSTQRVSGEVCAVLWFMMRTAEGSVGQEWDKL